MNHWSTYQGRCRCDGEKQLSMFTLLQKPPICNICKKPVLENPLDTILYRLNWVLDKLSHKDFELTGGTFDIYRNIVFLKQSSSDADEMIYLWVVGVGVYEFFDPETNETRPYLKFAEETRGFIGEREKI